MSYKFNLKNNEIIDSLRSPYIYEFNLARNLALLSNDAAIIRYFYQVEARRLTRDQWLVMQLQDKFLGHYEPGNAFCYFGIIPMIAEGKTNLLSGSGFECKSGDTEIDAKLNELADQQDLFNLFSDGVYWESGIGDFAYRLSYDPATSSRPLIDVVEPQNLEVNYNRGLVRSFVVKEVSDEDANYELHEIHYLNDEGYSCISYRYYFGGSPVAPNDKSLVEQCRMHFPEIPTNDVTLPIKGFATIVYKQNANQKSKLYKGKRGVPDIQGIDEIENSLSETISGYMDAIRKAAVREYVDEQLVPQDAEGRDLAFNPFNKRVIKTRGSSSPGTGKQLWEVVQGDIKWQAFVENIQLLISTALNKAGLSPTTIGLTGIESINSSAESQEARERTSLRTRTRALESWRKTITELINKYLQICDYINGDEVLDYKPLIKIHFDEYVSPSTEHITETLVKQVSAGIKSPQHAIKDLNKEYTDEDAEKELMDILALSGAPVLEGEPQGEEITENSPPPPNANLEE